MKRCSECRDLKPFSEFHKRTESADGYATFCKVCKRIADKRARDKKPEHYNRIKRIRIRGVRAKVNEYKSSRGCINCSEKEPSCLDMHHLDPTIKENSLNKLSQHSWDAFLLEAQKCVVICSNCHRKLHAGKMFISV